MSNMRTAALAILVLVGTATGVQAQGFGAQLSWGDDVDLGVGARLEANVGSSLSSTGILSRALFVGSFDYFFPGNDVTYWEANANLAVPVGTSSLRPYLGAGLNLAHTSVDVGTVSASNNDLGLNLLGGIHLGSGKLQPYAEARFEAGGGEQLILTAGIMLGGKR
jgi:hypothetical protein